MTGRATSAPAGGLHAHLVVDRPGGFHLDVELHIEPGRTAALLGPNGAGKSTAVAALSGLLALDGGRITLDGRVLDDPAGGAFVPPEDRGLGVVFQDHVLFPHLSAVGNVAFGLRSRGVGRREASRRARAWLDRVGLAGVADERPGRLSGGQAQRVALARALAMGPGALLLDEPLSALDVTTRTRMRRTLADHLAGFAGPRLLITHDPADAFLLAERIHVLEAGRLTQSGRPDEVRRHPLTPYVADLAGVNLLTGTAGGGMVDLASGAAVQIADRTLAGPVLVTIHPTAVSLHTDEPHGSPRNTWRSTVTGVEPLGERVRVELGPPLALTAEVTDEAAAALGLRPGRDVWAAVKATEIDARPER